MMLPSRSTWQPKSERGPSASAWSRRSQPRLSFDLLFALVLILCVFVSSSVEDKDPIQNFCRRFGHQTAVIDRKLYIDGGLVNWNPISSYPDNYTNQWLLYQDLDHNSPDGMPQLYPNASKNGSIPNVNGGILWEDDVNKKFYLFGGEYHNEPPSTSFVLYAYDAIYNHWDSLGPPQQASINSVSYGAGVALKERGEGYYYGGWLSNNSVSGWSGRPLATNGLVKYEMESNSWTNSTGPNDGIRRAEGAMSYIPAGDGGMLVYFGGIKDPYSNGTVVGQPLSQIFLYDVLSSKWYTQNATGTVPDMRRRFCVGVTWPPDQTSYNIYLYGGAGLPPNTAGYDDVYVLSIPAFTWTKLYPTDGEYTGEYPHHSLSCNVISGAQMLIIGGTGFPLTDYCDVPAQWGTHNLDMGEQNPDKSPWQLFSPNKTNYIVPDPIISAIGGSAGGGATKTAPAKGWDNADLKILMTRKATVASRTPTRTIPTPTGGTDPGGPLSTGAIAGIAVGGGIALIAALLAVCCFIRRHRRKRRAYDGPPGVSHGYSDSLGVGMGTPWSPQSEHSHFTPSPFLQQQSQQGPAELAAGGTNVWGGAAGGATYEMGMSPHSPGVVGGSSPGTGTGSSGGYDVPKFDDQGRMWVPQVSNIQMSPGRSPLDGRFGPGRTVGPQELSSDPSGEGGQEGELPSRRRVHQTYYHA